MCPRHFAMVLRPFPFVVVRAGDVLYFCDVYFFLIRDIPIRCYLQPPGPTTLVPQVLPQTAPLGACGPRELDS